MLALLVAGELGVGHLGTLWVERSHRQVMAVSLLAVQAQRIRAGALVGEASPELSREVRFLEEAHLGLLASGPVPPTLEDTEPRYRELLQALNELEHLDRNDSRRAVAAAAERLTRSATLAAGQLDADARDLNDRIQMARLAMFCLLLLALLLQADSL
ncbi:MAG: hypothetical protein AB1758_27030, partial [Candidatus Eremiobacterota bacterium]